LNLNRSDPRRRITLWRRRIRDGSARLRLLGSRAVAQRALEIGGLRARLAEGFARSAAWRASTLDVAAAKLQALGPSQTLQRGYAIAYDARGAVLTDSNTARIGEKIGVELKTGWLGAIVNEKKGEDGKNGRKEGA
jgi:exodeoxyribonuclease VII large subunit